MPKVDIQFRIMGREIPVDHGYFLFSAVSEHLPLFHSNENIGIHPINGILIGNRLLALTDRSRLTVRIPAEEIPSVLRLAGLNLRIGDYTIQVGIPETRALIPRTQLYSRLVVIKGFMEPEGFLEAAEHQLISMQILGKLSLITQRRIAELNKDRNRGSRSPFLRRTIRIRNKEIVGFALRVEGLTAEDSVRLQEEGIGGRRRFGCGIFTPDRSHL